MPAQAGPAKGQTGTANRIPLQSYIDFDSPEPERHTYQAKVHQWGYCALGDVPNFKTVIMPDEAETVLSLEYADEPDDEDYWALVIWKTTCDVRPQEKQESLQSAESDEPPMKALVTVPLIEDGVERSIWFFPEVRKLWILVKPRTPKEEQFAVGIKFADTLPTELEATGKFFRDSRDVFKSLTTDQLSYVNVVRDEICLPRGTFDVPKLVTYSQIRSQCTQSLLVPLTMDKEQIEADRVEREAATPTMSFTGHLASESFKSLVEKLRSNKPESKEDNELEWEVTINLSAPKEPNAKQTSEGSGRTGAVPSKRKWEATNSSPEN